MYHPVSVPVLEFRWKLLHNGEHINNVRLIKDFLLHSALKDWFRSQKLVTVMRPNSSQMISFKDTHTHARTVGDGWGVGNSVDGRVNRLTCFRDNPSLLPPVDSIGKLLMSFQGQKHYITYTHAHTLSHTPTHTAACRARVNGIYCYCDNLGVQQWFSVAEIRRL